MISDQIQQFIDENLDLCARFKDKKVFIVNHTSFYGRVFEKFFTLLGNEIVCGSRENGFDVLNKKDVDFWFYKQADIIIYPGIDFSEENIECKITTSVNLVVGLANLLKYKKDDCIIYYFNSNQSDLLHAESIYSAIDLSHKLCDLKKNTIVSSPWGLSICKENIETAFPRMIKELGGVM